MTKEEISKILFEYYIKYYSLCNYINEKIIYINSGELEKIENDMRVDLEDQWEELLKGN